MNRKFGRPATAWRSVIVALLKALVPSAALAFLIFGAYSARDYVAFALFALFSLALLIKFVHRETERVNFYPVELSDDKLILLWDYLGARRVFDRRHISGVKHVRSLMYFRHLGWPHIFVSGLVNKDEISQLVEILDAQAGRASCDSR